MNLSSSSDESSMVMGVSSAFLFCPYPKIWEDSASDESKRGLLRGLELLDDNLSRNNLGVEGYGIHVYIYQLA